MTAAVEAPAEFRRVQVLLFGQVVVDHITTAAEADRYVEGMQQRYKCGTVTTQPWIETPEASEASDRPGERL